MAVHLQSALFMSKSFIYLDSKPDGLSPKDSYNEIS